MADQSHKSNTAGLADKGKGKARDVHEDVEMGENESEDDESGDDFEDHQDEDNMEEIDLNNIVEGGRRTRGKVIDFAKAAEQTKDLPVEEDEEEDDDYEAPDAADEMEH